MFTRWRSTGGTHRLILTITAFQLATVNIGSSGAGIFNVTLDTGNDRLDI